MFPSLETQDQEYVLDTIAKIFAAMQKAELPVDVNKFGGFTFDANSEIVSGEATIRLAKPTSSYLEWKFGNLRSLLDKASQNPVLQGWEANGVKARIEMFLDAEGPQKSSLMLRCAVECLFIRIQVRVQSNMFSPRG